MSVAGVVDAATAAFPQTLSSSTEQRAAWLEAVAADLDARVGELIALADEETHLGAPRLTGELARTTGQLRFFATVIREGAYLEATIDHADPSAVPPKPDLRRMLRPIGPVAVFSASNFPFAFSVAGGDTASALAAGNPVVVKGHSAHPRLSVLTAGIVTEALRRAGAPDGVFAHIAGREAGTALVAAPGIKAVGFTGSLHGGRALFDIAVSRPEPIPFYGELSAVNPVIITPAAAAARGDELASGLAGSFQLGAGQFCTKPGVVLIPADSDLPDRLVAAAAGQAQFAMLSDRIAAEYETSAAWRSTHNGVQAIREHLPSVTAGVVSPTIFLTDAATALDGTGLLAECFGPTTLLVRYSTMDEALAVARATGGNLTATIHAQPEEDISDAVAVLTELAGRVLFAGWPTGVAVTWAQQHGGPWPSTTSLHTSVGSTAIRRFLRPIAYQDAPQHALPAVLRDGAGPGIPRRIDGQLA